MTSIFSFPAYRDQLVNFIWSTLMGNFQNKKRTLFITDGTDLAPFIKYIFQKWNVPESSYEVVHVNDPEALRLLSSDPPNKYRIVLLSSLIGSGSRSLMSSYTRLVLPFCKERNYSLHSTHRNLDSLIFSRSVPIRPLDDTPSGQWLGEIAHNMAIALSKCLPTCYDAIVQNFHNACQKYPAYLPSVFDCLSPYLNDVRHLHAADLAREYLENKELRKHLLSDPNAPEWIVLWSAHLAMPVDGKWQLSPALMEWELSRDLSNRIATAYDAVFPAIYMAWSFYFCKRFNLNPKGKLSASNPLYNRPSDIRDLIMPKEGHPSMLVPNAIKNYCQHVVNLRNYIQHGNRDYFDDLHLTSMDIIRHLNRDGDLIVADEGAPEVTMYISL